MAEELGFDGLNLVVRNVLRFNGLVDGVALGRLSNLPSEHVSLLFFMIRVRAHTMQIIDACVILPEVRPMICFRRSVQTTVRRYVR